MLQPMEAHSESQCEILGGGLPVGSSEQRNELVKTTSPPPELVKTTSPLPELVKTTSPPPELFNHQRGDIHWI